MATETVGVVCWEGAALDLISGSLDVDGRVYGVTAKPASILALLMDAGGGVVSHGEIMGRVDCTQGGLDIAVQRLRAALTRTPLAVLNERGAGFRVARRPRPASRSPRCA